MTFHTQNKSIREEFEAIVRERMWILSDDGEVDKQTAIIMSAFDTALEAIAVQVQENIRKPKHQECSNGNHEPCDVCVATDVWNRSQDLSATIIRSHKKEI